MESKSSQWQSYTNRCLLCRSLNSNNLLIPISQFKTEDFFKEENDRVYNNWAKNCIESITRVLKIPKVNSNFLNGSYCQECIQLMRDVNFTLIQLDNFQNKIIKLRLELFKKLNSNYHAIQNKCITTTYADIEEPSNLEKHFTLDEVIIMVYEKIEQDTEEWPHIDTENTMKLMYPNIQTREDLEVKYGKSKKNHRNGDVKVESINRKLRNRKKLKHDQKKIIVETSCFPNVLENDDDDSPPDFGNDDDSDWSLSDNEPVNSLNQEPETILPIDTEDQRKVKVHKDDTKPYHCGLCQRKFKFPSSLLSHTKQHDSTKYINCKDCGLRCVSQFHLDKHIIKIHYKKKQMCSFCDKMFENEMDLFKHENIHLTNAQPFKCIICHVTFTNSLDLKKHSRTTHEDKNYICDTCGKELSNEMNLKIHKKIHGPNYIGHKCGVCSHVFDRIGKLERHMSRHSDEKKYICEICGTSFKYNTSLKLHSRKHDGIYPFVCKICGKGFTISHYLKHHEEIHSGTLSYECNVCHKKFKVNSGLQQHLKTHDPKKNIKNNNNNNKRIRNNTTQSKKIKENNSKIHTTTTTTGETFPVVATTTAVAVDDQNMLSDNNVIINDHELQQFDYTKVVNCPPPPQHDSSNNPQDNPLYIGSSNVHVFMLSGEPSHK